MFLLCIKVLNDSNNMVADILKGLCKCQILTLVNGKHGLGSIAACILTRADRKGSTVPFAGFSESGVFTS